MNPFAAQLYRYTDNLQRMIYIYQCRDVHIHTHIMAPRTRSRAVITDDDDDFTSDTPMASRTRSRADDDDLTSDISFENEVIDKNRNIVPFPCEYNKVLEERTRDCTKAILGSIRDEMFNGQYHGEICTRTYLRHHLTISDSDNLLVKDAWRRAEAEMVKAGYSVSFDTDFRLDLLKWRIYLDSERAQFRYQIAVVMSVFLFLTSLTHIIWFFHERQFVM